jgi:hypothetical protein
VRASSRDGRSVVNTPSLFDPDTGEAPPVEGCHYGFKVVGIPPEAREEAMRRHLAARADGTATAAWDETAWRASAPIRPVCARGYALRAAAEACRVLAQRAGWEAVEVHADVRRARRARGRARSDG